MLPNGDSGSNGTVYTFQIIVSQVHGCQVDYKCRLFSWVLNFILKDSILILLVEIFWFQGFVTWIGFAISDAEEIRRLARCFSVRKCWRVFRSSLE